MITFKEFLNETGWTRPRGREEHDEVLHQLKDPEGLPDHVHKQLKHLADPENYKKALSNARRQTYTKSSFKKVDNTDAHQKWNDVKRHLNPDKVKRAEGSAIHRSPIILHHKATGHQHLLAGNTRASANHKVTAHVIDY